MICPVCRRSLVRVNVSGIELDYCADGCRGIWFDQFELKKLDEKHEGAGPWLDKMLSDPRRDDERCEKLSCPRCAGGVKLRRRPYTAGVNLDIDECYTCGGIWLDGGELAALRENYRSPEEREKIAAAIIKANPEFAVMERARDVQNKRNATLMIGSQGLAGLFRFLTK